MEQKHPILQQWLKTPGVYSREIAKYFTEKVAEDLGFFLKKTKDPDLSEELTQEFQVYFLEIFKKRGHQITHLEAYRWTCRTNFLYQHFRDMKKERSLYSKSQEDFEDKDWALFRKFQAEETTLHAQIFQKELWSLFKEFVRDQEQDQCNRLILVGYISHGFKGQKLIDYLGRLMGDTPDISFNVNTINNRIYRLKKRFIKWLQNKMDF